MSLRTLYYKHDKAIEISLSTTSKFGATSKNGRGQNYYTTLIERIIHK